MRRPGAAVVLLLALWVCLPAAAVPAASAATVPTIVVDPTYGPPLTTLRVTGRSFCPAPCSPVSISAGSLILEAGVAVDAGGRFTTFIRLPGTVRPGEVTISASQTTRTGSPVQASTTFTVTISVPAPKTYPPPQTIPAPGGLPPRPGAATPTRTVAPTTTPSPTHTPGSSATTKPTATSGPATTTGLPTATATATAATIQASPTSAPSSGTSPVWWVLLVAAAAAAVAGGVIWLRRRPKA